MRTSRRPSQRRPTGDGRGRGGPFWDARQGEVMAHERGTLYGLPIYHGRKIRFSPKDPLEARHIFIQRALVEADLFGQAEVTQAQKQGGAIGAFFWHNLSLIKQIEALEHRSRRQDVLVDEKRNTVKSLRNFSIDTIDHILLIDVISEAKLRY